MKSVLILVIIHLLALKADASDMPVNFKIPNHPRLLLWNEDKQNILDNIASDKIWESIHLDILAEAERMILLPELERKQIGMRLLAVSREAFRRIFFLSYSYGMTKDNKYLERAESEMLAVSSFTDWNPSHFLDVAEMTMAVSIGYDWLHDNLSDNSRAIISTAIINKGLQPSLNTKYNWFLNANHNWNQVCNAGMVFGALAIHEIEPEFCDKIIKRSIESVRKPMHEYSPDGAYPEGYAYWEYGTTFNVLLIDVLEKIYKNDFGLSGIKGFMDSANYFEHMTGPSGKSFNYADCGKEYGLKPAMFWFADKKQDSSLLWVEKTFLSNIYSNNYLKNRILPAVLLWGSSVSVDSIKPPVEVTWSGRGINPVALMRSSWTDPDAIYVGLKGGTASSNHAHMDAGSFVMEANGVRWAMDFGSQDYESLESYKLKIWANVQDSERWKVFRYNNYVHNTPTINGKLHNVNGNAPIISHSDKEQFKSAVTDLSPVFNSDLSSYKRGIAIIENRYVVIRDEVNSLKDKEAVLRWTMLTSADATIDGNNIMLRKDGRFLRLNIVSELPVDMKTWSTQLPNDYDAPNPGTILVGFECIVPQGKDAVFEVFLLPEGKDNPKLTMPLDEWY